MLRVLSGVCFALSLSAIALHEARADVVKLEKKDDGIVVTIDGKAFTTYNTAKSQPKPYFWPVLAANGANLTRSLERPEDHPHHKGIWCVVDEVNHIKFWAEEGKIAN